MLNLTYNKSIYKDSDIKWGDGLKLKLQYATPAVNGGPAVWGSITGELSAQTDLYSRLTEITDSVGKKADKTYVDTALSDKPDKSEYQSYTAATEEKINSKADKSHTHVLKDITDYVAPDLTPYALKTDVENKLSDKLDKTGYTPYDDSQIRNAISAKQDKGDYALKGDSYTKAESDGKYLTEHQDISGKLDKTTYDADKTTFATKTELADKLDATAYTKYNDSQVKADIKALQDGKLDKTDYTAYNDSQIKADIDKLKTGKLDSSAYTPYNDSEIRTEIAKKADAATTYTKTAVDNKLANKLDKTGYTPYDDSQIKSDISALKTGKLDTTAYTPYNDTEIKSELAGKADTATTYTKTEVNNKLNTKLDSSAYTKVDTSAFAKTTDVDTKLANKVNTSDFNTYTAETATKLSNAGKVDDVKVNGASVVTDKVANIDLSSYALKTDIPTGSSDSSYTDEKEEVTSSAIYNLHERIEKVKGSIGSKAEKTDISDLRGNLKEKVNQSRYDSDTEVIASAIVDLDNTKLDSSAYTKVDTSAFAKTTDVDSKLATKLDATAYTKYNDTQVKSDIKSLQDNKLDKTGYTPYNDTEIKSELAGKADTATTYTKTEVDNKLAGKADTATTYAKTEVDNKLATKQDSGTYVTSNTAGATMWFGSQTEYDAITTKDSNTIYIIKS